MFGFVQHVAGVQQRLGWDAAHVQAGAAEGVAAFDARHFHTQLGAADGADITAWAGTDNNDIIAGHGEDSFGRFFGVGLASDKRRTFVGQIVRSQPTVS